MLKQVPAKGLLEGMFYVYRRHRFRCVLEGFHTVIFNRNGAHILGQSCETQLETQLVRLSYLGDEVDGHTLAPESAGTPYTVDVVLAVSGKVVVDDQRHLKHSNSDRQTRQTARKG